MALLDSIKIKGGANSVSRLKYQELDILMLNEIDYKDSILFDMTSFLKTWWSMQYLRQKMIQKSRGFGGFTVFPLCLPHPSTFLVVFLAPLIVPYPVVSAGQSLLSFHFLPRRGMILLPARS